VHHCRLRWLFALTQQSLNLMAPRRQVAPSRSVARSSSRSMSGFVFTMNGVQSTRCCLSNVFLIYVTELCCSFIELRNTLLTRT